MRVTRENLDDHRQSHNRNNSWWLNDAMGIPLCRVCDDCETAAKSGYRPEVLGEYGRYTDVVEEQIEEDF